MKKRNTKSEDKLYTFSEFKKKFFPNVKFVSMEEGVLTNQDTFMDIFKRIKRQNKSTLSEKKTVNQ